MQTQVECQEGVGTATVQPAEDRVQKRPAAIESMRLRQACDPRDQVSEPWHDLWAAVAGMIESTDVPNVWLSPYFEVRDSSSIASWTPFTWSMVMNADQPCITVVTPGSGATGRRPRRTGSGVVATSSSIVLAAARNCLSFVVSERLR